MSDSIGSSFTAGPTRYASTGGIESQSLLTLRTTLLPSLYPHPSVFTNRLKLPTDLLPATPPFETPNGPTSNGITNRLKLPMDLPSYDKPIVRNSSGNSIAADYFLRQPHLRENGGLPLRHRSSETSSGNNIPADLFLSTPKPEFRESVVHSVVFLSLGFNTNGFPTPGSTSGFCVLLRLCGRSLMYISENPPPV